MVVTRRSANHRSKKRGLFVILDQNVQSAVTGELLASELARLRESGAIRLLEDDGGLTQLKLGRESYGVVIDAPLPQSGPWPLGGTEDPELVKAAFRLQNGSLLQVNLPNMPSLAIPIAPIGSFAGRGKVHRDINGKSRDGVLRGPFDIVKPPISPVPTYPMLWGHDAPRERQLIVHPDSEGCIRTASGGVTQSVLNEKAADVWATASRPHYNLELRFNSQSLVVAMTEEPCVGGSAWASVLFDEQDLEYPFSLWCNSTLGILLHWWFANKTQSGRGRSTITQVPLIPTLDVRT